MANFTVNIAFTVEAVDEGAAYDMVKCNFFVSDGDSRDDISFEILDVFPETA